MGYFIWGFILLVLTVICVFGFSLWLQHRISRKKKNR